MEVMGITKASLVEMERSVGDESGWMMMMKNE